MKKVILCFSILIGSLAIAQDVWQQIDNFPMESRALASFGTSNGGIVLTDEYPLSPKVFAYDPNAHVWEQKQDFPYNGFDYRTFVLNDEGYVMSPMDPLEDEVLLFKYIPATDTWEQKASVAGSASPFEGTFGGTFSVNNKGYLYTSGGIPGQFFKEYDPISDTWEMKADYPGIGDAGGQLGFNSTDKGYFAFSYELGPNYDFWSYDPVIDSWERLADVPWIPGGSAEISFSIGENGYIGMSDSFESPAFYRYLTDLDVWERIQDCGYHALRAFGFAIGDIGYVGIGGLFSSGGKTNQVWRFSPLPLAVDDFEPNNNFSVYPNPTSEDMIISGIDTEVAYKIYGAVGNLVSEGITSNNGLSTIELSKGVYFLKIISEEKEYYRKFIKN